MTDDGMRMKRDDLVHGGAVIGIVGIRGGRTPAPDEGAMKAARRREIGCEPPAVDVPGAELPETEHAPGAEVFLDERRRVATSDEPPEAALVSRGTEIARQVPGGWWCGGSQD